MSRQLEPSKRGRKRLRAKITKLDVRAFSVEKTRKYCRDNWNNKKQTILGAIQTAQSRVGGLFITRESENTMPIPPEPNAKPHHPDPSIQRPNPFLLLRSLIIGLRILSIPERKGSVFFSVITAASARTTIFSDGDFNTLGGKAL